MSQHSKITVVMAVYNAEAHLEAAVASVLSQTWRNIEIIVVDDGSTDGSWQIARRFTSAAVTVIRQPNAGGAAARNHGLRLATGDYIQFLDADDLLAPDKIERQVELLAGRPTGHVASAAWAHFVDDPREAVFAPEAFGSSVDPVSWLLAAWLGAGMMQTACWLVPHRVARQAGPWNERLSLHDDGEYFCRVLLAADGVLSCPEARVYYRRPRPSSLSRRRGRAAVTSALEVCESYEQHLLPRENTPRVRHALARNYASFLYEFHPQYPDLLHRARERVRALSCDQPPTCGGKRFQLLARLIGFDRALAIRAFLAPPW